jgi:[ribosomal protein S5]-alanine N-acetyltransferase
MLGARRKPRIETARMTLRLPAHTDWRAWSTLREDSATHLTPWEPVWAHDHLTRRAFTNRVYWAARAETQGTALPMLLIRREDQALLGAITLDNIRRGPAQTGTLGYWIGAAHARQGFMREAILAMVHHAFTTLDISRVEAACLPDRAACWRNAGSSMRAWRKAICRSTGAGAIMCCTRICGVTGGGGQRWGKRWLCILPCCAA